MPILLCALFIFSGVQNAQAQSAASPSAGCTAANAGDFDLSSLSGSSPVANPFSASFAASEELTFTLDANGGGVAVGLAEDTTAAVEILNSISETSANYTIPADGSRSFNIELDADDFDASISVSCTPAPQGSITISKDAGGLDGEFNFTGDLGAFTVSVAGEPSPQTFSSLMPGVYTIAETPLAGFALENISCTGDDDNGSIIDIASSSVEIDLDPGENILCTFTNAQSSLPPGVSAAQVEELSSHAIRNFLYRRASALLSAQPDRARLTRKQPEALGGVHTMNVSAGDGRVEAEFAASTPVASNKLDVWVEGHYVSYEFDGGTNFEGDLGVVYVGADYLLSDNLLIGVLGQLDWASESAPTLGEDIEGGGWMAGPYLSARLQENLFFDVRAAWGRSSNDLSIEGVVTEDEFETNRWLVSSALTGNRQFGKWRFTPTLSVIYFEEEQEAYESLTEVEIPEQTIALGRATFEPEFAYQHVTQSGVLIEPQLNLAALWDFETPDDLSIPGWLITTDEFRLRAGGGFQIAWPNGFALRANGFYEGIGAENLESYGARVWFDAPLGFGKKKRRHAKPAQSAPQYKTCADGTLVILSDECPLPAPPPIEASIVFAESKANLSPQSYETLSSLWSNASGNDVVQIRINASGGATGAEALAIQRAKAVEAALINLGAPADRIELETTTVPVSDEALVTIEFE